MEKDSKAGKGGIGCFTAVGIVFLVLKLAGVAPVSDWSWWWVLAPFWLPVVLGVSLVAGAFLVLRATAERGPRRR